MSYEPVSPEFVIKVGSFELRFDGSFELLKAIEKPFQKNVLEVQASIQEMTVTDLSRLICAIAFHAGQSLNEKECGKLLLEEVDITSVAFDVLKAELMVAMALAMTPPSAREKKKETLTPRLDQLRALLSPGEIISA
jgi:hypothetical protein